ncbi:hypothetical protein DACRYDRAFT_93751 [Dacryopinax primogenitus]|uniref:Elongator complex protein 5 n=1 Tax=Dacryopinax primogenitus (strain DJM 731) TaxID=1858805 RepID=M5G6W5_DACPD|nr:uncharacterized protein DACRYDRAFT_93751 [Dacryopinax primogenitus]EJU04449.1 hypothetical protein DACRYDRAFT_93751 [Dacryopinax primogenitus]
MLIPLSLHSQLAELLIHPVALSGRLTHLLFYSPSILHHLATNFLVLPPPYTDASKFWALFTGAAHRGEGMNPREVSIQEGLVESRVRKRTLIQRALEGWKEGKEGVEACDWRDLEGMKLLLADLDPGVPQTSGTDPTQGLSFNLSLTPAQEQARGAVPLPYTHAGQPEEGTGGGQAGILYEPDEGDDVDEEDPDEDLDI